MDIDLIHARLEKNQGYRFVVNWTCYSTNRVLSLEYCPNTF